MAIVARGQINITNISDSRKLYCQLGCDKRKHQIYDPNTNTYTPNWATDPIVITPIIYINQDPLPLNASGLAITYKRREGISAETALTANETVSGNILTVNANKLSSIASGQLMYLAYITYNDPNTGKTVNDTATIELDLLRIGEDSKLVDITGEQIFKYDKNGSLVGSTQITLTANATNVNISKWQYKKSDGTWADYPTTSDNANITSATLIVKPTHAVFFSNVATIRVLTSDSNITDVISITKLNDGATGATGAGGLSIIVGNEAQTIACTNGGLVTSAVDITIPFKAFKGTTQIATTVAVGTLPSGVTVKSNTAATASAPGTLILTFAANATLGAAATLNGVIDLTFTLDGKTVSKTFSWSKSKAGNTGATGSSAVNFDVYAPNGSIVRNGAGSIALQADGLLGANPITSGATYQWAKLVSGAYVNISGATDKALTISGADVVNLQVYKCTMTYGGKTYIDTITVEDKSDPYTVLPLSSSGTQLKNGQGDTIIRCLVFQNGLEVDPLITEEIGAAAPASPKSGDFWYKVDKSAKTVTLMKYSGSAWATATEKQTFTYKWYRNNSSGTPIDTSAPFKTGKVIYVKNGTDIVTENTVFNIEVDDGK